MPKVHYSILVSTLFLVAKHFSGTEKIQNAFSFFLSLISQIHNKITAVIKILIVHCESLWPIILFPAWLLSCTQNAQRKHICIVQLKASLNALHDSWCINVTCDQKHELPIREIHGQSRQWAKLFKGEEFCVF